MDFSSFTPGSALVIVVALALAPFAVVMVTSFTKIVVVLSLLRSALGLQQVPPNIVINGLALVLSLYVMQPVLAQMTATTSTPGLNDTAKIVQSIGSAQEPLRQWLIKHSNSSDRVLFVRTARRIDPPRADKISDRDFIIILPAFLIRELSQAFQIGFLIFLPFLVIDLVISNILLAMGMMMLSPTTISLPFKLLLFVVVDGWVKLAHGLVLSYS